MTEKEREEFFLNSPKAPEFKRTREWAEKWVDQSLKEAEDLTGIKAEDAEREILIAWYLNEIDDMECEARLDRAAYDRAKRDAAD